MLRDFVRPPEGGVNIAKKRGVNEAKTGVSLVLYITYVAPIPSNTL